MDKNTLSNYGWIVCVVLVISMMIALATPFATAVKNSVVGSTNNLSGRLDDALANIGNGVNIGGGSTGGGSNNENGGNDDVSTILYKFKDTIDETGSFVNQSGSMFEIPDAELKTGMEIKNISFYIEGNDDDGNPVHSDVTIEKGYLYPTTFGTSLKTFDILLYGEFEGEWDIIPVYTSVEGGGTMFVCQDMTFEIVDYGVYRDWMIANTTLVNGGNEITDPEMNEYGFYFNQPYKATTDGVEGEIVFYADGSAASFSTAGLGICLPAGYLRYENGSIVSNEDSLVVMTVSNNGTTITDNEGEVFVLDKVTQGSLQKGKEYKSGSDYYLNYNTAVFDENGSITITDENGVPVVYDNVEYFGHYFIIHDETDGDILGCVYPDGSKFILGDEISIVYKLIN